VTASQAQYQWNRGMVGGPAAPAGRQIPRPGDCRVARCGELYTGRAPAGLSRVLVAGSREPERVYCPDCVGYGRALAEVRALPVTVQDTAQDITHLMVSHHQRARASWAVAYDAQEQATAVLYTATGAPTATRRRQLAGWQELLTAAGYSVEPRDGGPYGTGAPGPWWLRVTAGGGAGE
jgi:hypothetical protein